MSRVSLPGGETESSELRSGFTECLWAQDGDRVVKNSRHGRNLRERQPAFVCPGCGHTECRLWYPCHRPGPLAEACYGSRRLGVIHAHQDIVVCMRCGWGVVTPLPSEEDLHRHYAAMADPSYRADAQVRIAPFEKELDAVASSLKRRPTSLLDVGCSYGLLLKAAQSRGIRALGLEPSADAVAFCRQAGLSVRQGGLEQLGPGDLFDVVFLWDVLEHLRTPQDALESIRDHLAPDGIVTIVAPDRSAWWARIMGERWWSIIDLHLHYPTKEGLLALLQRCGFAPEHIGTHPKTISPALIGRWIPWTWMRTHAEKWLPKDRTFVLDPRDQALVRARAITRPLD